MRFRQGGRGTGLGPPRPGHRDLPFVLEAAAQPMGLPAHAGLMLITEAMLALGLGETVAECPRLRAGQQGSPASANL